MKYILSCKWFWHFVKKQNEFPGLIKFEIDTSFCSLQNLSGPTLTKVSTNQG